MVQKAIARKTAMPIVRFADGEYAFYRYPWMQRPLPAGRERGGDPQGPALARRGHANACPPRQIAPLVFPGKRGKRNGGSFPFCANRRRMTRRSVFSIFSPQTVSSSRRQLRPFLRCLRLSRDRPFCKAARRQIGLRGQPGIQRESFEVGSRRSRAPRGSCTRRFAESSCHPLGYDAGERAVEHPARCRFLPRRGGRRGPAGLRRHGRALPIPAIDAGHVMNMMNDRVDKSNGPRLYTLWKEGRT